MVVYRTVPVSLQMGGMGFGLRLMSVQDSVLDLMPVFCVVRLLPPLVTDHAVNCRLVRTPSCNKE